MNWKIVSQVVLGIAAVVLAYFIFESIMIPQRFETIKSKKEAVVVTRLKDIRAAEMAYRGVYGRFCKSLDSLVMFLEDGKLPTVKKTGEIPDSLTEEEALRKGLIHRDTVYTEAYGVLFPNHNKAEHLANFKYVPYTNRTIEFSINAGFVERGLAVWVPVIEVSTLITEYMQEEEGKYGQLIRNSIKRTEDLGRFPGVKFGSMLDPQTEGNWE